MKTRTVPLIAVLAVFGCSFFSFFQHPVLAEQQKVFRATLTELGGDSGRKCGEAVFTLAENGDVFEYVLRVQDLADITMAHLHFGTAGDIGSPVVWLYPDSPPPRKVPGSFSGVLAEGSFSAADLIGPMRDRSLEMLIEHIRKGHVYVNIHTAQHLSLIHI